MDDAERELRTLSRENANNWIKIGSVLLKLESISPTSPSTQTWSEILLERLYKLDAKISPGHLHKIRRAAGFLNEQVPGLLKTRFMNPPKISSIEVAERLHRLDAEAGLDALRDALKEPPTPYVELKHRYDLALEQRPEQKSPRQIGWEARRKAAQTSTSPDQMDDGGQLEEQRVEQNTGPSTELSAELARLLDQAWREGWLAAEQAYLEQIKSMRLQIVELEKDNKFWLKNAEDHEIRSEWLAQKMRALGHYPEDYDDYDG